MSDYYSEMFFGQCRRCLMKDPCRYTLNRTLQTQTLPASQEGYTKLDLPEHHMVIYVLGDPSCASVGFAKFCPSHGFLGGGKFQTVRLIFHPEHWGKMNPILTCAFFSNKRLNPPTSFGLAGFTAKPGVILRTKTPPGFSGAFTRNQGRGSFRSLRGNTLLLAPFIDLLDIWKTATKHKICERCILRLVYIWVPNIFRCSSLFGGNDLIWQADVSYGLKPPTWCSSTTKFVF